MWLADLKRSESPTHIKDEGKTIRGYAAGLGWGPFSNRSPFFCAPQSGGDKGKLLLSDTWISLFGGDGGGRNQASRGGGP